jgi:hypothetical protein
VWVGAAWSQIHTANAATVVARPTLSSDCWPRSTISTTKKDDQHHEEACYDAECHYRQRGEESGGSPTRGIGSTENPGHSEQPGGHCDRDEEATRPTVALERDAR